MVTLGKYDYACDTLLSDSTWASAIANSTYYASVLDQATTPPTRHTSRYEVGKIIFHGAIGGSLYYLDGGSPTPLATIDTTTKIAQVSKSSVPKGTYAIYDTVAKNPSDLTDDYSKTITITDNTTEVYVMPDDGVLYWWGNEVTPISTSKQSSGGTISKNTDNISIGQKTGSSGNAAEIHTSSVISLSGKSSLNILIKYGNTTSGIQNLGCDTNESYFKDYYSPTNKVDITPSTSMQKASLSVSSFSNSQYCGYATSCFPSSTTIYALWLE